MFRPENISIEKSFTNARARFGHTERGQATGLQQHSPSSQHEKRKKLAIISPFSRARPFLVMRVEN